MNKYGVISFLHYGRKSNGQDTILIKYENIEPNKECFKGITVISTIPEKLEIIEISDDKFRWQPDEILNFYGPWEDISSEDIPIFEAVDDDTAKLIFETDGYE